jgi:hypothetical protein
MANAILKNGVPQEDRFMAKKGIGVRAELD